MSNKGTFMQALLDYLSAVPMGPIADTSRLERLLVAGWDAFDGSHVEGMAGSKLHGRMEDVAWNPPRLSFMIERHGGFFLGSSRADRHKWNIDLEKRTASFQQVGHRQVRPIQPKLDVRPIAKEIVQLIIAYQEDERLK